MSEEITTIEAAPRLKPYAKWGIFFTSLGLVIFITAYCYGYFQLLRINMDLAHLVQQLDAVNQRQDQALDDFKTQLTQLQTDNQTQAHQLADNEKILAELNALKNGNMDRWHVAESEYLVKIATERLLFTKDATTVIPVLEHAQALLAHSTDSQVQNLQEALSKDLSNLQALPKVDIQAIYQDLNQLDGLLGQLELPIAPLSENKVPAEDDLADLPWWKKGLQHSVNVLKQIVIVKRSDNNTQPLVMPEEKAFLYQNLRAQLQQTMWGLLHRNEEVYQSALSQMTQWINTYFAANDVKTQQALTKIQSLQQLHFNNEPIDFSATLTLFEQYLNGNQSTNAKSQG